MIDIKTMVPSFKGCAFFMGWIGLCILIAGLCWFLTGSVRNDILINAVNRTAFYSRERVYLEKPIPSRELSANEARMGSWFSVRGIAGGRALVFTLFSQGSFLPCMALINSEGKVEEILPLSVHAQTMLLRIPGGALNVYVRRIEEAVK